MAEFTTPQAVLAAARRAREEGYHDMDAYTPYPVEGLSEELGFPRTRVPFVVLVGGLVGAGTGFLMQYWTMAVDYPFNVGGKPLNSWPAFIPITFELMVLVGAFSALLGTFFLNGLPQPYHPVFNVPQFAAASQDRFFLCIEASDPRFDLVGTRLFLESLHPEGAVVEVPH
ncbi:MAG: DUF3341 domain-containing protein [Planctomycetes bacterium]|nr:DUF3341 domain-containing protein [Planctomycetota bacterium]